VIDVGFVALNIGNVKTSGFGDLFYQIEDVAASGQTGEYEEKVILA